MKKYHQGFFKPRNPEKYKGNVKNIVYRSGWELNAMNYFDKHPDIVKWSSEEVVIPYISPVDNKRHRYFVDFWVKTKNGEEYLIEVKPKKQTKPPEKPKNKRGQKRFIQETLEYVKNQAKWKAALKYAASTGMKFIIMTEDELKV